METKSRTKGGEEGNVRPFSFILHPLLAATNFASYSRPNRRLSHGLIKQRESLCKSLLDCNVFTFSIFRLITIFLDPTLSKIDRTRLFFYLNFVDQIVWLVLHAHKKETRQNPYPIIVYYRPHLSLFGIEKSNFRNPTLVTFYLCPIY